MRLLAAAALLLPFPAVAQHVDVAIDEGLAEEAGLDPVQLEADLDAELRSVLHLDALSTYLTSMAGASFLATKGMGTDYASNVETFVVGGSVGTGIDDGGFRFGRGGQDLPPFGYAFQATAMAGLNLGVLAGGEGFLTRVTLYGHGMALGTSGEVFAGSLSNAGGHVQVKIVRPRGDVVARWGGLDVTSGFERSRYEMDLTHPLPVDVPGTDGRVSWDGQGTLTLTATTDSVPIELSTNVRILFLTLFGGGGVDLVRGAADGTIALSGDVVADVDGRETRIGSASVTWTERGVPASVHPRLFAGAQVNVLPVKLYAMLNAGVARGVGGHVGLRIAK
jgi:hypothetical protein